MTKVRVNLANSSELCEIPGIRPADAEAIVKFRSEHGPIQNADQLAEIVGGTPITQATRERLDFDPAAQTAPEAPGA